MQLLRHEGSRFSEPLTAIRNDDNADIRRHLHNLQDWIGVSKVLPGMDFRSGGEDLRDLVAVSEIQNPFRNVIALKHARLNVEIASKIQVLFNGVRDSLRITGPLVRGDTNRKAICVEVISHSATSPD